MVREVQNKIFKKTNSKEKSIAISSQGLITLLESMSETLMESSNAAFELTRTSMVMLILPLHNITNNDCVTQS